MSEDKLRQLFKDTAVNAPDDFENIIMSKLQKQTKPRLIVRLAEVKYVNLVLGSLISVGLAVYYIFWGSSSSKFDNALDTISNAIKSASFDFINPSVYKSILGLALFILLIVVMDILIKKLFYRKK